jgi:spore maturation protein CgeB
MKILAGGMNYKSHGPIINGLARVCELKCLDIENADFTYELEKDTIHTVLNRISESWHPDIIFWWIPEYNTVINKIEESPYPVFVFVMDWNLSIAALKDNLKRFDWIFIDRAGVEVLNRAGYQNVSFWKICSFDQQLYRNIPELEKIYDVVFIGHFNHNVHRERSKLLKRLALLGKDYNIKILTGVYGEENPRYLNRSKICFNYSVRGEANLRTFESTACKILMFLEDANLEVKDFFADKQECVYYNENNLEELVRYYLKHPEESEKIATSAYNKVQQQTYFDHFRELITVIRENNLDKMQDFKRQFNVIDKQEKLYQNCLLLIQGISKGSWETSLKAAEKLVKFARLKANSWNTMGVIYGNKLIGSADIELNKTLIVNSLNAFNRAKKLEPNAVLPYYNSASVYFLMGNDDLYMQELLEAFSVLEPATENLFSCRDLFFPSLFDLFRVTWEKSTGRFIDNQDKLLESYKNLLKWNICEKLGDYYHSIENFTESLDWYDKSINSFAEISGIVRAKRGIVLYKSGQPEAAIRDLEIAWQEFPFDPFIWFNFINILFESNQLDLCRKYCEELMIVIKSCPYYESELVWLQPVIEQLTVVQ